MVAKEMAKRSIGRHDTCVSSGGVRAASGAMGLHGAPGGEAAVRRLLLTEVVSIRSKALGPAHVGPVGGLGHTGPGPTRSTG